MDKLNIVRILCLTVLAYSSHADVRLPPDIVEHPDDAVYRTDSEVILECTAEGSPPPEFEWLFNEKTLDLSQHNIKAEGGSVGTITIKAGGTLDEGYYQCIAKNQYGTALSQVAHIRRAVGGGNTGTNIVEYTASVGETLKLKCDTGKSYPPPIVSWLIADSVDDPTPAVLPLSARMQIDLEGNLYFMNVEMSDYQNNRIYKCQVTNPYLDSSEGGSYSRINVVGGSPDTKRPELIYSVDAPVTALLHAEELVLKCLFSGYPTPRVSWSRKTGGQMPLGRNDLSNSDTTLTIKDVQWGDEGDYECSGYNDVDSVPHRFFIDVKSAPLFSKKDPNDAESDELKPMNLNRTEQELASFYCKTDAEPDATIQWLVNGELIDSDQPGPGITIENGNTNFTVHDLCKTCPDGSSDLVVVQCNSSNIYGYAYSQGYLNVLERTELTTEPEDVNMAAWEDEVVFHCGATSDDSTPVTIVWKHDGVQVNPDKQPEYVLDGDDLIIVPLEEEDAVQRDKIAGKYTCEADNGYTKETASAYLTLPEAPVPVTAAGFNILDYWWVFLIIVLIILIILLLLLCYICYQRNKGDEYAVDEKDRKNGYDPEKELVDSGFHDFQRPEDIPFKGSRASLTSTIKIDTDDEASLLEYGEPDTGKFNEDGSFIGLYHDKSKRYNDSTA